MLVTGNKLLSPGFGLHRLLGEHICLWKLHYWSTIVLTGREHRAFKGFYSENNDRKLLRESAEWTRPLKRSFLLLILHKEDPVVTRAHVWKRVNPTWVISLPPRPLTASSRPTRHAVLVHGLMEWNRTAAPKPINQPLLNEPHARSHRGRVKGCVWLRGCGRRVTFGSFIEAFPCHVC